MSDKQKSKWLQGCLIGCAIAIFLGVVLIGSCGVWVWDMRKGFDQAIATRTDLEHQFGTQEEFVPRPDGSIPAESLERFLAVRSDLEPLCTRFEETFGAFERMDDEEEEGRGPEPGDVFRLFKGALGMAPLLADFFAARNVALLEAGLGLGEYTYIRVIAYESWLDLEASHDDARHRRGSSHERIHEVLIEMLQAQRAQLRDEDPGIAALDAEINALREDPERVPWEDGVPAPVADSLEPFRDRLEASFCAASAEFDLSRNKSRGMTIEAD